MLAKETDTKATPTMRPVRLVSAVSSRLRASETARNSSVNLMGETLAVRISSLASRLIAARSS